MVLCVLQAFDAYDQNNQAKFALACMKYMILAKVLNGASHEVPSLLASKMAAKYTGSDLEAMSKIAAAAKSKSLEAFRTVVRVPCCVFVIACTCSRISIGTAM